MSDDLPPTDEPRPLAAFLFGWTFGGKARVGVMIALAAVGALLVGLEIAAGIPYQDTPGFYALIGFGAVVGVFAVAHLWRVTLGRLPAPGDEP